MFIILALMAGLAIGVSGLIHPSAFSYLIAFGAICAIIAVSFLLSRPAWSLYVAVFVTLLPNGLFPAYYEMILSRFVACVALVAWACSSMTQGRQVVWSASAILGVCFVLLAAVTLFWANDLGSAVVKVLQYVLRVLVFLLLMPSVITTRERLNGLMKTVALFGYVYIVASIIILLFTGWEPGTTFHMLGVHTNEQGIIVIVGMLGIFWHLVRLSKRYETLSILMASVLLIIGIVLVSVSASRGCAISLFLTVIAFCFWKETRSIGILGLLIVLSCVVMIPGVFTSVVERFEVRYGDTFFGHREVLWRAGLELIREQPFRGVGIGGSASKVSDMLGYEIHHINSEGETYGTGLPTHNPVLTIWIETGILGVIVFLGILTSAVWSFIRQYQRHRLVETSWLLPYFALVSSGFVGYMASWIKSASVESSHIYFFFLSLLVIPASLDINESLSANGDNPQKILRNNKGI